MTDRIHALTVVLAEDIREDDAQSLMQAICMFKNVLAVHGHVKNFHDSMARDRVRHEMREQILHIFLGESK